MFEFIGMVVVAWIIYMLIKAFFRGNSTVRSHELGTASQEIGIEARYIAVKELGVPEAYYNYSVTTSMDKVKNGALEMKELRESHKNFSWPRLIAWTVYGGFRFECERYQNGNQISKNRLDQLGIPSQIIVSTLLREPEDFLQK